MKVRAVEISNICGLEELIIDVGDGGLLVCGDNGVGKTSVLTAIKVALAGRGIGDEAIRVGADQASVQIRIDDKTVRKVLGRGSKLDVTNDDGARYPKPVAMLQRMLGTDSIDPLALLQKDAKKVKAAVFAACPVEVSREFLCEYVPRLPEGFDTSGHGLDVIEQLRKIAYDKRTAANARSKELAETARRAQEHANSLAQAVSGEPADPIAATATRDEAKVACDRLQGRHEQAQKQAEATASQRAHATGLRERAEQLRSDASPVPASVLEAARGDRAAAQELVDRLTAELARAKATLAEKSEATVALERQADNAMGLLEKAYGLDEQADELEASIAALAVEPVPAEAIEAAKSTVEQAEADLAVAVADADARLRSTQANIANDEARYVAESAAREAARLDEMVKRLTNEAPAALVDQSGGIPGLTVQGDDIYLDGVNFSVLNGAQRVRLAVQIAKRTIALRAPEARVLICDGLEALSKKTMEVFVQEATEGGWQLFGSRVTDDDRLVLIPLGQEGASE